MGETNTLPLACPDCAARMPETAAFCPGCGRPMHTAPRSLGKIGVVTENIAGALAYLTFIPAIIFLVRLPYKRNPFVRFHSIQCLLLCLASAAIAAAFRLIFLVLILIPVLGPLLVTLIAVIASIAAVVLWVVLVVKAFQGETFKLPLLGDIAATYAEAYSPNS